LQLGYLKDRVLCHEYKAFEIDRTRIKAKGKLPTGKVQIQVELKLAARTRGARTTRLRSFAVGCAGAALIFTDDLVIRHRWVSAPRDGRAPCDGPGLAICPR
jgi:hypothetical protein